MMQLKKEEKEGLFLNVSRELNEPSYKNVATRAAMRETCREMTSLNRWKDSKCTRESRCHGIRWLEMTYAIFCIQS